MVIDSDFSDVDQFFDDLDWEVQKGMIDVGDAAVKDAEESGTYQDHTLTLRTSNTFDVDKDELTLENTADYASYVEAKGFEVFKRFSIESRKETKRNV